MNASSTRRDYRINLRLNLAEYTKVQRAAQKIGKPAGSLGRHAVLEKARKYIQKK